MSSKAMTENREERPTSGGLPLGEIAPSVLRSDEPTVARWIGGIGLFLVVIGAVALIAHYGFGRSVIIPTWFGTLGLVFGMAGLLFHSVADGDPQVRRLYWVFGLLWLTAGVALALIPKGGVMGGYFLTAIPCWGLGLLFLLAFLRHEDDPVYHERTLLVLAGAGGLLALTGFIGSNINDAFLLPYGFLTAFMGVFFIWAFISVHGSSSDIGYKAGLIAGAVGVLALIVALARSVIQTNYFIPTGLALSGLGLLYLLLAVFLCSDNTFVVLTRRELTAYFYSPIAYFVLVSITFVAMYAYWSFLGRAVPHPMRPPLVEPVIRWYLWGLTPVLTLILIVPLLTMRLLSEEKRSGTYEVLMTAPVTEVNVVLSKFTASLLFFLLAWLPWALFLVDLRVEVGKEFDYRPLLSFFVLLALFGANFLAMGLFFSAVTSNQIGSAVLTTGAMLLLTGLSLARWEAEDRGLPGVWLTILNHVAYLNQWFEAMGGMISPRAILFHVCAAVFWLFLTVKWLESRRWS